MMYSTTNPVGGPAAGQRVHHVIDLDRCSFDHRDAGLDCFWSEDFMKTLQPSGTTLDRPLALVNGVAIDLHEDEFRMNLEDAISQLAGLLKQVVHFPDARQNVHHLASDLSLADAHGDR